ncbi:hypothetical protein [Micromonospora sp. CPCC 205561]|uniref:hypothetical protein n=1 Tax=Micromonospora sp. CPCC 205561 TaxID=3122407 RepID=UPI002FF22789
MLVVFAVVAGVVATLSRRPFDAPAHWPDVLADAGAGPGADGEPARATGREDG